MTAREFNIFRLIDKFRSDNALVAFVKILWNDGIADEKY
jgi:hypothetical protein